MQEPGATEIDQPKVEPATSTEAKTEVTADDLVKALEAENARLNGQLTLEAPTVGGSTTLLLQKVGQQGDGSVEAFGVNNVRGLVILEGSKFDELRKGGWDVVLPKSGIQVSDLRAIETEPEMSRWRFHLNAQREDIENRMAAEKQRTELQRTFQKDALEIIQKVPAPAAPTPTATT